MKWDKNARVSTWFYLLGIMFILFAVTAENSSNSSDLLQGMVIKSLDGSENLSVPLENVSIPALNETIYVVNDTNLEVPVEENITNISLELPVEEPLVVVPEINVTQPLPEVLVNNVSTKVPKITLKNKNGGVIGKHNLSEREGKFDLTLSSKADKKKGGLGIAVSEAEAKVEIYGLQSATEEIIAVVDDYLGEEPEGVEINTKVFAISEVQIDNATITLPKTGFVNKIFRCNNFDEAGFNCLTWEATDIPFIDHGDTIEFNVNHFSAYAGGEIIAVNAEHLDGNYSYISNVYDTIKVKDGTWSEPIYAGEIVRVTYETELNNGNTIDIFARSNHTTAYIEVYEVGTNHFVGRSPIIESEEWQYFQVDNLTQPTSQFDFKIIKVYPDLEDDSSDIFANITSFIEFDYIHDDAITSTVADGLVAYGELNIAEPYYRLWNATAADFGAQLTDAQVIGTGGTDDITWVVTKANHERDEIIVGTEDKSNDVNIQIYNSTKQFGNLLEVTATIPNSALRAFDIGIEDISGDALIVYEGSTAVDSIVYYRIWNGTGYSAEQTLTTSLTGAAIGWVSLTPKLNSDQMMLLLHTATTNDIYFVPWNGTAFDTTKEVAPSNATVSNIQHFSFAWEDTSGDGLAFYGSSTDLVYTYYNATSGTWGSQTTILALGDNLLSSRSCSDPYSDYIGLIVSDVGTDVNVRIWGGSSFLASPPAQDAATEAVGTDNGNIDCAWFNSTTSLFGFVDANALTMDYFTFTKANTWSTADLTTVSTTATIAADDIAGLRFTKHPTTSEIMIIEQDIGEDVRAVRWTGSAFVIPTTATLEGSTEVLNAAQESAQFDWYRYDPVPAVTNLAPNGASYATGTVVNITVNVSDNIAVSIVSANITLPNGTISQVTLSTSGGTGYNASFSDTSLAGVYTIRIIANDTSSHQNYNTSVTSTFTITDTIPPAVVDLRPVAASTYSAGNVIEVAANVTDNVAVSTVSVNITYPNSTIQTLTLTLATGAKYNASFTIPGLNGQYNLTFIANDTSNNLNTTETTYFTVSDATNPSVIDLRPIANSTYNTSNVIEIAANVTDNAAVSAVLANITYSNGTVQQLTLSLATGSKYNNSFTIPHLIGRFNVTIISNDSSNNVNSTEITYFVVNDANNITVTDLRPVAGTSYNISNVIEIAVNATDNIAISAVLANITYPNSTVQQLTLSLATGAKYNTSFTAPSLIGRYNVTFIVNDTSNNYNHSETTYFYVNDTINPNVTDLRPLVNSSYNISNVIEIAANVTDNYALSSVLANITYSNGTVQQLTLSLATGSKYNSSFTIPNLIGRFNVTIIANDTSNNLNSTETTYFIVNDVTSPSVTDLRPVVGTQYNISNLIDISANVSDNIGVGTVLANLSYPNGTIEQLTLINSAGARYNYTFTAPTAIGRYNLTFIANDTSNNLNITETTYFMVNDVTNPVVVDLLPIASTQYNISNVIEIAANVTDNIGVGIVLANITYPNFTVQTLTLSLATGAKYNISFTAPNVIGTYTVRIITNDTSNNLNTTETTTFVVNDVVNPVVVDLHPVAGTQYNISNVIEIAANVSDDVGVSTVRANVTYPNSTVQTLTLSLATGSKYNTSFTAPANIGTYIVRIIANDTSNNLNTTETTTFVVNDVNSPAVVDLRPIAGTEYNISNVIDISANVTDNIGVGVVLANITYPNGTLQQITLVNSVGARYNSTFTAPVLIGRYNVTLIANDTSNNLNASETTYFIVNDVTNPVVVDLRPVASTQYNISNVIEIAANITDNIGVGVVLANITYPNSTVQTLTLSLATGAKYNTSFTAPAVIGTYTVRILANDTSNNLNTTETTTFVVNDVTNPVITVTGCVPNPGNQSQNVTCNATITDDVSVNTVSANLTLPNGTVVIQNVSNSSINYWFTTNSTSLTGIYNITWRANDTSNNVNTAAGNFTILDVNVPVLTSIIVTPSLPVYNNGSEQNLTVNFTSSEYPINVTFDVYYTNGTFVYTQGPVSLSNSSALPLTFTIWNNLTDNTYLLNITASDMDGNNNTYALGNFSVDSVLPYASNIVSSPALPLYNNGSSTTISVNFTSSEYPVNFTFNLYNNTGGRVNYSSTVRLNSSANLPRIYTLPALPQDNYTLNFTMVDLAGNTNSSNVGIIYIDTVSPVINSLVCQPTNINLTQSILCNSTVTDNLQLNTVWAYVVLPNGTSLTQSVSSVSSNYFFNFTNSSIVGRYNLTWYANDSSGNSAFSASSFNVSDVIAPTLTLNSPANGANISASSVNLNLTVTDNYYSTLNCSVYLNGTYNQNNAAVVNGTPTLFALSGLQNGSYSWNITCNDASGNVNYSETRTFMIDTTFPNFISLTTSPNTEAALDPGVNVTVYANVTYDFSGIDTVILQRKLSNVSEYTNQTLTYNTTSGFYEGSFNASGAGIYNLKLVANNTAGNIADSNIVNITVGYEYSWVRTPSVFTPISATIYEAVNLGILTINNTADFDYNFSITSDSNETTFNESTNFTLASGEIKLINVSDNATSSGIKIVTLTINASGSADPSSQTTTGNIVVAPGQPILVSTFTTPATEAIEVTQGDTNVEFVGTLENIGEGNATNVTFYLDYPTGWVITFGASNLSIGDMYSGDTADLDVQFTIPSDFTFGSYVVSLTATGYNETGGDLSTPNLIFGKNITVTVNALTTVLGGSGRVTTSSASGTTSPGGGGSGGGTPAKVIGQETFNTTEVIKVVRGTSQKVPVGIRNVYTGAAISHLSLTLLGFMSDYVTFTPKEILVIPSLETKYFYLTIYVPPYFTDSEYNLTIKLTSNLIPQDPEGAGYYSKQIVEYRTVILRVQEDSKEDITIELHASDKCLQEMRDAHFFTSKAEEIFAIGKKEMDAEDYTSAKTRFKEVCTIRNNAFQSYELLQELQQRMEDALNQGVKTPLTQEQVDLAKIAFDRGDFLLSRDRIQEGQLAYALETRSKVKILQFLENYWYVAVVAGILLILTGLMFYKRFLRWSVGRKIWLLDKEEKSLVKLIDQNYNDYFNKKKISLDQFKRYSEQYEKRLGKLKQNRLSLRVRRVHLMDTKQEQLNLSRENEQIKKATKENQENYLLHRTISKQRYEMEKEALEERNKEIYQEEQLVKDRLRNHAKTSKVFKSLNRITDLSSQKEAEVKHSSSHSKKNKKR